MLRAFWRRLGRDAEVEIAHATWPARALAGYAALQRHFALPDGASFREHAPALPTDQRYAYLWPFSQAWMAALDLAAYTGDRAALAQARRLHESFFAHYWDSAAVPPSGAAYPVSAGGGDVYYDDNAWIGLALVRLAQLDDDHRALTDAARVFTFVASGWDDDASHPAPGGVLWTLAASNHSRDRNTCSNGPGAQLGLALAELARDRRAHDAGRRMYAWAEATLRDPADGLYWDHIKRDGTIERTKWSYNQGSMLGAATLLAELAGEPTLLDRARALGEAAVAHYAAGDRLWAQDPAFNAIFFDNLHTLGVALERHDFYLPLLTAYAERAWAGREPRTNLCHFGQRGRVDLLTQSAAVRIFALLAGFGDR